MVAARTEAGVCPRLYVGSGERDTLGRESWVAFESLGPLEDLDEGFGGNSFVNRSLNSSMLSVVDTMITGRVPRGVVDRVLLPIEEQDSCEGLGRGGTSPEDEGAEIKDVRDEDAREVRSDFVDWELEK